MKRTLTIIAALVVLAGLGTAIYFIFFSANAPKLSSTNGTFSSTSGINSSSSSNSGATETAAVVAPGLVEITSAPVAAGEAVFDTLTTSTQPATTTSSTSVASVTTNSDIAVHYIDRASGNIYEYLAKKQSLTRIGNKTLPGIQLASWLPDGSMAFVQFLSNTNGVEHVETYALQATSTNGYFLQEDLAQATAVGSHSVFTLVAGTDSSIGTIANADGSKPSTLFTSPLTSIQLYPAGTGYIAVPHATNSLAGYAFAVGSSGIFTPILGPLNGLSVLPSPSGKQMLFSYTDNSGLHMSMYDGVAGAVTNFPIVTLAEKCVWTSDSTSLYCAVPTTLSGTLPDAWYQGAVSFSDRIWKINIVTHTASLVLDPTEKAKQQIDAVNLTIDPQNQLLVFRNKKNSSLWAYNI